MTNPDYRIVGSLSACEECRHNALVLADASGQWTYRVVHAPTCSHNASVPK